jgi:hypothetical protein
MEALVYGAWKVSTTTLRQFQVRRNRAHQAATTCSDIDGQKATVWLQCKIHQVTPAKRELVDKLFQRYQQQLFKEVVTRSTSHWI